MFPVRIFQHLKIFCFHTRTLFCKSLKSPKFFNLTSGLSSVRDFHNCNCKMSPSLDQDCVKKSDLNSSPPSSSPLMITISVDGNISSGKSTLVSNLKELFPKDFSVPVQLVPEPLEKWTDLNGHNLLGMFYQDPVKHNFMFQSYVQLTRLVETIKKPQQQNPVEDTENQRGTVRIMERSLQNNRYCFTELAKREGRLQPEEFAVLSEWYNWMEKNFDLNLDLIIYLRTSPETVFNRMKSRGRAEESTVPLDYLQKLHEAYEDWLTNKSNKTDFKSPKKHLQETTNEIDLNSPTKNSTNSESGHKSKLDSDSKEGMDNQKIIVIDGDQGKEEVARECQKQIRNFMAEIGYNLNVQSTTATPRDEPNELPKKKPRNDSEENENTQIVS